MSQTNFLIGRGELLTMDIKAPAKNPGDKAEVYPFARALERLTPQLKNATQAIDKLDASACPEDFAVVRLMLNPGYVAKSYFPVSLLRSNALESIGSRTVKVTPEAWTRKGEPTECTTTELFVAGKRSAFRHMLETAGDMDLESKEAKDFAHIEQISAFAAQDRIVKYSNHDEKFFEVGIHLLPDEDPHLIQTAFFAYAKSVGIHVHAKLNFTAGNLWFLPVEGDRKAIEKLAQFTFIRVIRPVPKLRGLRPVQRTAAIPVACTLPQERPLSDQPRVAILDGGLPAQHPINNWLGTYRKVDEKAADAEDGPAHGLGVTSAFLFGPIQPGTTPARPFSFVDHLRVLDQKSDEEDPFELYRTLGMIEEVLLSRLYEFLNLSLGPDLPIEDTDVHAWTSVIDEILSDGNTFMTVAVGNNGERDRIAGNARVQVPADCVNAVSVGAANDTDTGWERAPYSAIGPGRRPGVIKPDLMAFGGDTAKYFHVLEPGKKPSLTPLRGTSFAAPYLLRSAVGVRAILGQDLTPLAIKALLVNAADPATHNQFEVGWGKIPEDPIAVITCPTGVARVVYQGELKPGKYLRAQLPIPKGGLTGMVNLKATFCYASPTDPQDAAAYTKAGLEVTFRPNLSRVKKDKQNKDKQNAETRSFFKTKKFMTEDERRHDAAKWETVLHGSERMRGSTLVDSIFDIHYNAREAGGVTNDAERIRYALIITIEAPKHPDLYNDILRAYATLLVPIRPQVTLPIRI